MHSVRFIPKADTRKYKLERLRLEGERTSWTHEQRGSPSLLILTLRIAACLKDLTI